MADHYENQPAWRERYGIDEYGFVRIKRAVKSTATALPTLVFYTLAPRQDQAALVALLVVAGLGFWGLIRLRTWGVVLLGVATAWTAVSIALSAGELGWLPYTDGPVGLTWIGGVALVALCLGVAPFVMPAIRFLRDPSPR